MRYIPLFLALLVCSEKLSQQTDQLELTMLQHICQRGRLDSFLANEQAELLAEAQKVLSDGPLSVQAPSTW